MIEMLFINFSFLFCTDLTGPLPSYDDALEDTVIFENRIQESQVIVKTSIGEAPPSFEDAIRDHANYRPPQYTEISEES